MRGEPPPPSTARELALAALLRGGIPTRRLGPAAREASLAPAEQALFRELVAGVERRRSTLDAVIGAYVPRPAIPRDLRVALRLGLFQILFLERVPAHAAVDETVGLARARRGARGAGFVNAVLRAVLREISLDAGGSEAGEERRALSVGGRRIRFGRPVFPDPASDLPSHLAARHAHPRFLVARWIERFGTEKAVEILEAGNRVPPITLRANPLRVARDALVDRLRSLGFAAAAGDRPLSVRLGAGAPGLFESAPYREGLFSVQDETAMVPVELLAPRRGERILDLCAAPGGKATQVAEAIGDAGEVLAADVSEEGLARVRESARRLGLRSIRTIERDPESAEPPGGGFDRVLVDAPCSNTGVLARRPEARWRAGPAALERLVLLQRACLFAGLRALRPGGRLVYSTCSLEPEENGGLVRAVLAGERAFALREERFRLPDRDADGGYAAAVEGGSAGAAPAL